MRNATDAVDEFPEAEQALLARYDTGRVANGQMQAVLSDWFPRLREKAKERPEDPRYYLALLDDAEGVLNKIKAALSSHELELASSTGERFPASDDPKENAGRLWLAPGSFQILHKPSNWLGVSPVNEQSLDEAIAEYLKRPWLQHNLIDWAAIGGAMFNSWAHRRLDVISGLAFGEIDWAALFSGGEQTRMIIWKCVLVVVAFLARWFLPPLVIGALIYTQYQLAAKVIGGAWALYIIYRIVSWPARRRYRREKEEKLEKYESELKALARMYVLWDCEIVNPTRFKQLVLEAESAGCALLPFVHSLLDRAIERDPAVFIRRGPQEQ